MAGESGRVHSLSLLAGASVDGSPGLGAFTKVSGCILAMYFISLKKIRVLSHDEVV